MKKYFYLLFFVFASHGMEKKINEIRKPRSSSTPTMVSVSTIAQTAIKNIYIMCMPRLLDNEEKVENIIQDIDEYYNGSSFPLEEVKKVFVEQYADKLGSRILRKVIIEETEETSEKITFFYDERTITKKREGDSLIRHFPLLTSPWRSLTFDQLLTKFSNARKAELHFIKEGKTRGPLWQSIKEPDKPLTPINKLLTKKEKRFSWHLGNR